MIDKLISLSPNSERRIACISASGFVALGMLSSVHSQDSADPAAASGMTTGLPGAYNAQDYEMQNVRAAANAARKDAQSAAIVRSADRALETQQFNTAVENQRARKLAKERAAEAARLQKAANAYNRVSLNQIQTWSDDGSIKVERGVPPAVMQQIAENDVAEAEAALEEAEEDRGAVGKAIRAPGNAVKGLVGRLPFGKDDEENFDNPAPASASYAEEEEKQGILKRVGGVFRRDEEPVATVSPATPQQPTGASDITQDINEQNEDPSLLRGIASRIPFVGGRNERDEIAGGSEPTGPEPVAVSSPVQIPTLSATGEGVAQAELEAPKPTSNPLLGPVSSPSVATNDTLEPPIPDEGKPGIFGRIRNRVSSIGSDRPSNNDGSVVDASLFPTTNNLPPLPAGSSRQVDSNEMLTGTPGGSAAGLPTQEAEDEGGLFSSITGGISNAINREDESSAPTIEPRAPKPAIEKKPRTTSHSGGNSVYVVANQAKFFRFGDSQFSSEVNDLAPGTVVQMVKAGDEWCSVRLASGATGNIKNSDLKPASVEQAGAINAFGPAAQSSVSVAQ